MTQTIAVLGADGYIGWPLTCRLLERGDDVIAVDDQSKRGRAPRSVTPIAGINDRMDAANEHFEGELVFYRRDITDYSLLEHALGQHSPDTVVNLAQIPAAPYSMQSAEAAWETQQNNVHGALNLYWALHDLDLDAHVVQLATMGEYPLGDDIPEGFLEDGRAAPKEPGSLYHASKVATTVNTLFLSRTWDIPTTEVYQGIVYGVSMYEAVDERLITRFNADSTWGTVINRFTAQAAVDHPLTVYGDGGQKRAMLPLADSIECLELLIDNPPERNPEPPAPEVSRYPYRAANQFDGAYRVKEVADLVAAYTGADIEHIDNPRVEDDSEHVYEPDRRVLDELGYEPTTTIEDEIRRTYRIIERHTDRICRRDLRPSVTWTGEPAEVTAEIPDGGGCVEAWEALSRARDE